MSSAPTLEDKIEEINRKIEEYTYERSVCVSLHNFRKRIAVSRMVLQPDILSIEKPKVTKIPDLLIIIEKEFVVFDVKDIHKAKPSAFESRAKELLEFTGHWKYQTTTFEPKLVMCVPEGRVEAKDIRSAVSAVEFHIDNSNVTLSPISDPSGAIGLFRLFSKGKLTFPLDQSPIHFLRSEPQISYVADRIYALLQAIKPIDLRKPPYYQVKRGALVKAVEQIFPPSLRSVTDDPIPQLAEGRTQRALNFLDQAGFVSLSGDFIQIPSSRGTGSADLLEHFIMLQARQELAEEERKKAKAALPPDQRTMFSEGWMSSNKV